MKDLFKSKGFTAGFIVLAVLILFLAAVLIYLLSGKGKNNLPDISTFNEDEFTVPSMDMDPEDTQTHENTEEATIPSTEESQEESRPSQNPEEAEPEPNDRLRALLPGEEHVFPVMNETIYEPGTLSVHRPEGLIFHTTPQFDGLDENNNILVNDGDFPVIGKIFVRSGDMAAMMYKTETGYFVTSDPGLVSYTAARTIFLPNKSHAGTYGTGAGKGVVVQVFMDDGNHVAFTIYNDHDGSLTPALENVVAEYEENGWANFEFMYDDVVYTGMIEFHQTAGEIQVEINLGTFCEFASGSKNFILLSHD